MFGTSEEMHYEEEKSGKKAEQKPESVNLKSFCSNIVKRTKAELDPNSEEAHEIRWIEKIYRNNRYEERYLIALRKVFAVQEQDMIEEFKKQYNTTK
ncbi:MAG: hypothetical protein LBD75_07425 [Candidatus Peribacteria bacterium]|jgi:hypothetical protein|nr:hypothetical protein [Candidatus Peribacteria bacterium]